MNDKELSKEWNVFGKIQVLDGLETIDVLIDGKVYMRFMKGDEGSKRMGIVQLYESGKGTQEEIAKLGPASWNTTNLSSINTTNFSSINTTKNDSIKPTNVFNYLKIS